MVDKQPLTLEMHDVFFGVPQLALGDLILLLSRSLRLNRIDCRIVLEKLFDLLGMNWLHSVDLLSVKTFKLSLWPMCSFTHKLSAQEGHILIPSLPISRFWFILKAHVGFHER